MKLLEELNSLKFKRILEDGSILEMYYENKFYNQWIVECSDNYDFFWAKGFNKYEDAYKYYNEVK